MKIKPISNVKSKNVEINENLVADLENYAKFLTAKNKANYEVSDILSAIFLDEKILDRIQEESPIKMRKITLKMPDRAWINLDQKTKRKKMKVNNLVSKLSKKILNDKKYLSWKEKN